MTRSSLRAAGAEFVGTGLLVGIGTGFVVAVAGRGGAPLWAFAVAWFFAVFLPIVLFARVSGAHLNPAVTFGLVASGRVPVSDVPRYLVPQFSGALAGSLAVESIVGRSAALGANLPTTPDLFLVFVLEAAFSALLLLSVLALTDRGEGPGRVGLALPAAVVGVATYVNQAIIGTCSLNPARALAPAILSGQFSDLGVIVAADLLGVAVVAIVLARRSGQVR